MLLEDFVTHLGDGLIALLDGCFTANLVHRPKSQASSTTLARIAYHVCHIAEHRHSDEGVCIVVPADHGGAVIFRHTFSRRQRWARFRT